MDNNPFKKTELKSPVNNPFKKDEVITDNPFSKSKEVEEESRVSQGEAALLGSAQGFTLGFSDEIIAGLKSLIGEDYDVEVAKEREKLREARDSWTKTYVASEVGGGAAIGVVLPFGSLMANAKTTLSAIKGAAAIGAVEGSIAGAGYSEASEASGILRDAAIWGTVGAVSGGALVTIVKGAKPAFAKLTGKEMEEAVTLVKGGDPEDLLNIAEGFSKQEASWNKSLFNSIVNKRGELVVDIDNLALADDFVKNAKQFRQTNKGMQLQNLRKEVENRLEDEESNFFRRYTGEKLNRKMMESEELDAFNGVIEELGQARRMEKFLGEKIDLNDVADPDFELYMAARHDTIRYMEYVVESAGRKLEKKTTRQVRADRYEQPAVDEDYLKGLASEFKQAFKAGQVNAESFQAFRSGQYLADAVGIQQRKQIHAHLISSEAYGGDLNRVPTSDMLEMLGTNQLLTIQDQLTGVKRKVLNLDVASKMIDDTTGLDTYLWTNRSYAANNQKKRFTRQVEVGIQDAYRKVLKEKNFKEWEDIVAAIENPDYSSAGIDAFRAVFKDLRGRSSALGLEIGDLGKTYVPSRKKSGVDLILAFEKKHKELGIADMDNNLITKVRKQFKEIDEAGKSLEEEIGKMKPSKEKEFALFTHHLQELLGKELRTTSEINEVFTNKVLRDNDIMRRSLNPDVAAVHHRDGVLPTWIREHNVYKLAMTNADQVGIAVYMRPIAKQLDSRIAVLNELGLSDSANYLFNYRQDILGAQRPTVGQIGGFMRMKYDLWVAGQGSKGKRIGEAAAQVFDAATGAIYPNMIGLNARSVLRNLVQPWTMTVPEVGWIQGSKYALSSYKEVAQDLLSGGWKKLKREAEDVYFLKPITPKASDFEGLRRGIATRLRNDGARYTQKALDGYSNAVMWGFVKSDEINRIVTLKIAKKIAADIMEPKVTGEVQKILNGLPNSLRNKIIRDKANDNVQAVTQTLGEHYVVATQLAYGKVGMHELGRDIGPLMTMLTKWPVAISSDMFYKYQQGEYRKILSKYFAPVIALNLFSAATVDLDSKRSRKFIGSDGFSGWLPVHSVWSAPNIAMPVALASVAEGGYKVTRAASQAMMGEWNPYNAKEAKQAAKRMTQQFVPIGGGMWRAHDNWIGVWDDE